MFSIYNGDIYVVLHKRVNGPVYGILINSVFAGGRNKKIKYVKARRNEFDGEISYIRNTALDGRVSALPASPISRNAASALRMSVYIAAHGYRDDQIPLLIAKGIFDLAEVRSFFPVDSSNLISFLPPGKGLDGANDARSEDNYHLMMENAASAMGIEKDVKQLYMESEIIQPPGGYGSAG